MICTEDDVTFPLKCTQIYCDAFQPSISDMQNNLAVVTKGNFDYKNRNEVLPES